VIHMIQELFGQTLRARLSAVVLVDFIGDLGAFGRRRLPMC
jgi:hypothetical protein